ncbi:hypothetical protein AVT97_gp18 [Sulfolobales Virus YNP2]|uniref:hypothetical protein n=1 Tax=Sulfolobales Virus YNP2 TaxID=1732180 RepID=UPI000706138A|nr:hypothetical protein AVT97_gp18 [Sulfolobales Virus YNP2]ALG97181.1 hypothetical protein [Sulfolobales Virus YNP2]
MRFIGYLLLLFTIGIVAAFLNLIEGIYYGLAMPTLGNIKIDNVSVKLPSNPIPFASNIVDVLILLIGMIIFMILIYIVKILRERNPYSP